MKYLLLTWMLLGSPMVFADAEDYFGCYRVKWYNGEENTYSDRFFMPSVNSEISNKHADPATGAYVKTVNFNFEVPLVTEDRVFLKFKFLEFPLPGVEIVETPATLLMENNRDFLFEADGGGAKLCSADRRLFMEKLPNRRMKIELSLKSRTPEACPDESHALVVEEVAELNCR